MSSLHYPKISIVTPSYNQGRFLEQTILSILNQNYPNLEYVIIDGGSTDNSVEIIKKYSHRLHYWESQPDNGMYDAINKGFSKTSGDIMTWLNSDDLSVPGALSVVAEAFEKNKEVEWLTSLFSMWWDVEGRPIRVFYKDGFSKAGFWRGEHLPRRGKASKYYIQQESTFWKRSLWEKAGGYVDTSLRLAGDFELWARFFKHSNLMGLETVLGGARRHPDQQSGVQAEAYLAEADSVMEKYGIRYYSKWEAYFREYLLYTIPKRLQSIAYKLGWNHPRESLFNTGVSREWKQRRWK